MNTNKGFIKFAHTVTYVCWRRSTTENGIDIQDWAARESAEALEFAIETSCANNVDFTAFFGRRNKNPQFFVDGKETRLSLLL